MQYHCLHPINLIPNIIYSIESGTFAPESLVPNSKIDAIADMKDMLADLDNDDGATASKKLTVLIHHADTLGYLFTDLVSEISDDKATSDLLMKARTLNGTLQDAEEG